MLPKSTTIVPDGRTDGTIVTRSVENENQASDSAPAEVTGLPAGAAASPKHSATLGANARSSVAQIQKKVATLMQMRNMNARDT